MTKTTTSYHTIERFIAGISTENIDLLSEAEIELLFNAAKKAGTPAWSLEHAQRIMADNIYAFRPPHGSPFENSNTTWLATKHSPRRPPPTAEDFDSAARAVYAAWMERRAGSDQAGLVGIAGEAGGLKASLAGTIAVQRGAIR